MRNFTAVDTNLDSNPKIMDAGWQGSFIFQALLRINRMRGLDGVIPAAYCTPKHLARVLACPEDLASMGLTGCLIARLVAQHEDGLLLVGYDAEWRGSDEKSADRVRKWREAKRQPQPETRETGRNVTEMPETRETEDQSRVEEKRGDKKRSAPSALVTAVLAYYTEKTGRRATASPPHVKAIDARAAEGHTLEDFRAVIDHKHREWGSDPKMSRHVVPATLFAPSHFAPYLDEAKSSPAVARRTPEQEGLKLIGGG